MAIKTINYYTVGIPAHDDHLLYQVGGLETGAFKKVLFSSFGDAKITVVSGATHSLAATDQILHVTRTVAGTCTITLTTAQVRSGRKIEIKDGGLNAGTNNISIVTEGSELIDGGASISLTADGNSVSLYSDGTNWFIH